MQGGESFQCFTQEPGPVFKRAAIPAGPRGRPQQFRDQIAMTGLHIHPIKPGRTGITLHEAGYLPSNRDWNYPSVFSPFWRLYHNGNSGHCVLFNERMVELTPTHIMVIPPHCLFHCLGSNPVPTFWLAFSFTRTLHADHNPPVLLMPHDTELCLIRDLKQMISTDRTWEPNDAIFRNSLALLNVVLARRELHWQPPLPDTMVQIRHYIETNIGAPLSNPILARKAGLSVAGFERIFKRHFGTTAARYVSEMRVREAARLLLQTDETIDAIADHTGFPNRAYFSRIFKNIICEAPAGFRRKHRR